MCGVKIILIFKGVYLLKRFVFIAGNVLVECNWRKPSASLQKTTMTPFQLKETTQVHVTAVRHIPETTTKGFLMIHGSSDHNSLFNLFHTELCKLFSFRKSSDFFLRIYFFFSIFFSIHMYKLFYEKMIKKCKLKIKQNPSLYKRGDMN